jgi:3-oxoadipate enol-lactonase/4-carboxymuconolactone decarboxylase
MEHELTVTLHYEQHGDPSAPSVLFLGSLGSDLSMWQPQIDELSANWHVIAVDHRGHGSSPTPQGPYTMGELGADIIAVLDSLNVQSAHYVGLSLGGAVGQWLAAHHPDRILSLTLLCTSSAFLPAQPWLDRAQTVRADGLASIAESIVSRWFSPGRLESDQELVDRHVAMVKSTTDEGYAACCEALATWDGRDDLARITAPTLVIAGEEDPATPPATMQTLAEGIATSEFHVVAPGAHLANVEQADKVTQLITDHLKKNQS